MANTTEVLNDLILINNDRIEGYEKAISETEGMDVDLKAIFNKMIAQSRDYVSELSATVSRLGETPETGTTVSGKIYRTWMDIKSTFASKERQNVLELCEFGEDAAQKAYDEALASDAELPADIRQIITDQKHDLLTSHDLIKKYRDMHKTVNDLKN